MAEWKKARKKPVEIEYREVEPKDVISVIDYGDKHQPIMGEWIHTIEGDLVADPEQDYIIRGVEGEIYPIKKDIFAKTYDIIG